MPRPPIRRLPALILGTAGLAAAVGVAACGPEVEGDPQVAVYLSAPLSGPRAADGRDVADGAMLAFEQADGTAAGTAVELQVLDDAGPEGAGLAATGANARAAVQDSTAVAYIGELESGATRTSLPITNEAGVLQVSPGAGASDLTRNFPGGTGIPESTQPSGARTFGRVVPSDVDQGEAAGEWIAGTDAASLSVEGGRAGFAESLRTGLEDSPAADLLGASGSPLATYLAVDELNDDPEIAARDLYGSDALLTPAQVAILRGAVENCGGGCGEVRATSAAQAPDQLPPAAAEFLGQFRAAYDRDPGPWAAYGFESMAVVLDSIDRAEDPLDRRAVIDALFATADRESILGTYSIDEVGETTLGRLGAYRVTAAGAEPDGGSIELP